VVHDSANVTAYGSANVTAYGSANVTAYGSANVTAYDSANVTAYDSANVTACDSANVTATRCVSVHLRSDKATIFGGVIIPYPVVKTPAEWCENYAVSVLEGVATLYKAVRDDYRSAHGMSYEPGSSPEAPDWDGGEAECGGGLHFSPHPMLALAFDSKATRFVACPVALKDIAVHEKPDYPTKVKARRVCGPIVEVDRNGKPLEQEEAA
jgi:hypothetical protein